MRAIEQASRPHERTHRRAKKAAPKKKKAVHHPPAHEAQVRLSEEEAFSVSVEKTMAKEKNAKVQRRKDDEAYLHKVRSEELSSKATKKQTEMEMAAITNHKHITHNAIDKKAEGMVKRARKQLKTDIGIHQPEHASSGNDEDDAAASMAAKLFKKLGGKAVSSTQLKAAVQQHVRKHTAKTILKKKVSKPVKAKKPVRAKHPVNKEHVKAKEPVKKNPTPVLVAVSDGEVQRSAMSIMDDLKQGVSEEKRFLNLS